MKNAYFLFSILAILSACNPETRKSETETIVIETLQGTSLLGQKLLSKQLRAKEDSSRIAKFILARDKYLENPMDTDALIWYGRRTAYLGDYKKAIEIYTDGIEKFPNDARIYRHRGHRYISIRMFDNAIKDLNKAVELITGTEDIIEPDGIPNSRNTPVSTLHNNIWYHLGLAHYLKNDMNKALFAFRECLKTSTNPDMLVATSHWLYMILRRLDNVKEASEILKPMTKELDVFENMAYHKLLLFYQQKITESELLSSKDFNSINDAIIYGLGNWYYYNGYEKKAKQLYEELINKGNWPAFGYIAAEADLSRMKEN